MYPWEKVSSGYSYVFISNGKQIGVKELKNVITKLKNTLEGFNSRLDEAEESLRWETATELTQRSKIKKEF